MGIFSKVFSYLVKKPLMNFAVEERAQRVLDKNAATKPTPAPFYETEDKLLKKIHREHPELKEKVQAKIGKLDEYLKRIKVVENKQEALPHTQTAAALGEGEHKDTSNLPKDRVHHVETIYGLPEVATERIPAGKLSFHQAMDILAKFSDSEKDAASKADTFNVSDESKKRMLQYFRPFLYAADVSTKEKPAVQGIRDADESSSITPIMDVGLKRMQNKDSDRKRLKESLEEQVKKAKAEPTSK